ncbi:TolC family protein [Mastigocoleus sp. MO_188.B34]|uniref:TolC family protein n=1 Tax=Mastigocoleus sp. MO_188.B34 TaxID=3036635 RepID=UPI002636B9A3|nr:TolC family protein [Mastigocoleus sp. MO_188.B34]MDJ0697250.1 TolC family protein [Mastigocoleus sp. MO_188.B34]
MKRQQFFYSFLPGVTAAVLTAHPALARSVKVDSTELNPSLDATNLRDDGIIRHQNQIFAQKLYSQKHFSTRFAYINWSIVKNKSTKTKTILPRIPQIELSREVSSGFYAVPTLDSAKHSLGDGNLDRNISHSESKNKNISRKEIPKRKKLFQNTGESDQFSRTLSKLQPLSVVTRKGKTTDIRQEISKHTNSRVKSLSHSNVSQETPWLTSSLQTDNCGASALLSRSGQCNSNSNAERQKVIASSGFSEQNLAKIRKPSLVNKLQRMKRVGDRESHLESNTTIQISQMKPQEATSPNAEPNSQEGVPPATKTPNLEPPATESQKPLENPNLDLNPNPNPLVFPTKVEEVKVKGIQPITLQQALELAQRNNRDLQESLLTLERSRSELREAQAALLPQLDLRTNLTRSQSSEGQRSIELQGFGTDEPVTRFDSDLQLSYSLYTSGSRRAAIKRAEESLNNSELEVERISELIKLNVNTDYYNLQEADEQVRIQRSAVENSRASLRDAEAQERAGIGTRFAVLQARSVLANDIQALNNALANQTTRRSQLAQRLSLPQSVTLAAADPVRLAGLWNRSLEESMILAFQNRPELQQQLAQRNISEQARRQALAQLGPQISVVGTYDLLDQFDDNVGVTDGYSLGLRATLRLFDGGAARAEANQQKANIAIAENGFAEQRELIRSEVERAYAELESNLKNIETSNLGLEVARESLRLARLRFQAGVGTQTDVIREQDALTQAEGNRVSAILGYNRALATLQRSITSRGLSASDDPNGNAGSQR